MAINKENYILISEELKTHNATLVAVSKTKPVEVIQELYHLGQRDFGENYVQELTGKQPELPSDIRWHFIGHLQSNKVKYIAPFVHLIQSIDSLKLLQEVNKQAQKNNRIIHVLLQVHIALEETKFGFDEQELLQTDWKQTLKELPNICLHGLMGMASFTTDEAVVRNEFKNLKRIFDLFAQRHLPAATLQVLSMGMSGDYQLAVEEGSNMVRIGSLIFGSR